MSNLVPFRNRLPITSDHQATVSTYQEEMLALVGLPIPTRAGSKRSCC